MQSSNPPPHTIKTRFLVLSDTHGSIPAPSHTAHTPFRAPLPAADVVLHCGDLSMDGAPHEYEATLSLLERAPAPLKLVVAGNHDLSLDGEWIARRGRDESEVRAARALWTGERARRAGILLLDEGVREFSVKGGKARLRIYTSPFTPAFCNMAFPYPRTHDRFNPAPHSAPGTTCIATNPLPDHDARVDVVMTHGPPQGILDAIPAGRNVGCAHLLRAVARCRPRMHCFGHIHEGWGARKVRWGEAGFEPGAEVFVERETPVSVDEDKMRVERGVGVDAGRDGAWAVEYGRETLMVNASIMTIEYQPQQGPWIVDLDLERVDG